MERKHDLAVAYFEDEAGRQNYAVASLETMSDLLEFHKEFKAKMKVFGAEFTRESPSGCEAGSKKHPNFKMGYDVTRSFPVDFGGDGFDRQRWNQYKKPTRAKKEVKDGR